MLNSTALAVRPGAAPIVHNQPLTFEFDALDIRVVVIGGEPWFVANDVCAALDLDRTATRKLDQDERDVYSMHTPGGVQQLAVISESGLYTLVLRSRDAMKQGTVPYRFRKWVSSDVLPTIRKTGGYGALPSINVELLMTQGLPVPSVQFPVEVEEAIEEKAWEMAREAHKLSIMHLRRYVAYCAESGWPRDTIDTERALKAVSDTDLGTALTQKRRQAMNMVDGALKVKTAFVPEIRDIIDRLIAEELGGEVAA